MMMSMDKTIKNNKNTGKVQALKSTSRIRQTCNNRVDKYVFDKRHTK